MSAGEKATTGFSFDVGTPIQEGPSIAAVTEATADQSVEGMDSMDVDEDNQFDTMKEEDERVPTNMKKFFPELVNKLESNFLKIFDVVTIVKKCLMVFP